MYDNNTLDTSFSQNSQGRLVAVQHPQSTFTAVGNSPSAVQFTEMYSYTQSGQVSKKRLQGNETGSNGSSSLNLDGIWSYDSEGKVTSVTYPSTLSYNESTKAFSTTPGPTYTYSFDSMHRYIGLTDQNNNSIASSVQYGPSNELLSIQYSGMTETRQYNNLLQLTQLTNSLINRSYSYPTGTNNGKMASQYNAISGETVTYQYDSLNRLISASGSGWSQSFGYDSFGNLLSMTGSNAPPLSVAVTPATNQIVGQSYDANGNQLSTGAFSGAPLTYDADNRLLHAPGVQYAYGLSGRRIWKGTFDSGNTYLAGQVVYFYGSDGALLGTYTLATSTLGPSGQPYVLTDPSATTQAYFGSKRVDEIQDNLGSTAKSGANGFFPYGEDRGTPQSGESFATYPVDSAIGLYYAQRRYYSSQFGRFTTPDPYRRSGHPNNPQSWNRYGYTTGDPINNVDPNGLDWGDTVGADVGLGDDGGDAGGDDSAGDGYVYYTGGDVTGTTTTYVPGYDTAPVVTAIGPGADEQNPSPSVTVTASASNPSSSSSPTVFAPFQPALPISAPQVPQPPDNTWQPPLPPARQGTWSSYASCFSTSVFLDIVTVPEPYVLSFAGTIGFGIGTALPPAGMASPVAAGLIFVAGVMYAEANIANEATTCSQQTGYVPWALGGQVANPNYSKPNYIDTPFGPMKRSL